jgi:hypothetical protein
VVSELSPGAFFGDLALLDNSPRSAQARALENCELAVFFRADFMGLMETDAVIGYKISLALARHIGQRLRDWMTGRPSRSAMICCPPRQRAGPVVWSGIIGVTCVLLVLLQHMLWLATALHLRHRAVLRAAGRRCSA